MSQWRDTLTVLHLVDRTALTTALTTAWTACWELLWHTEDMIRPWGMLAEEEGGVRGWICDVMRPIRQLVYLASVRGPLMAAPASYQYIVSITLPPYQHAHTHTDIFSVCIRKHHSLLCHLLGPGAWKMVVTPTPKNDCWKREERENKSGG